MLGQQFVLLHCDCLRYKMLESSGVLRLEELRHGVIVDVNIDMSIWNSELRFRFVTTLCAKKLASFIAIAGVFVAISI
jgi:hypothetical protein